MENIGYYLFYFLVNVFFALKFRAVSASSEENIGGQITFAFQVFLSLFVLSFFLPLFEPFYIAGEAWYLISLSVVVGILGAASWVFSYMAQKHVEAGATSVISNINTLVAIILASLFINEGLTILQIFGAALLLVAMFIVSKKHRIGKFKFDKYFMFTLLAGVTMGGLVVLERILQTTTGFSAGIMFSWWAQFLFLGIIAFFYGSKNTYTKKDVAVVGVARALGALSWVLLVFVVGNLSFVSAVTRFQTILIFIAAAIFLKEREDLPRKIFGSILAVIGLLLMR